ncbi:hypothetical protein V1515DRAFT_255674 [Lipomyces mesembrius]
MQKNLNLGGNDLNYLTAVYYTSYLSFMIPGSFLLTHLPIQRVLPPWKFSGVYARSGAPGHTLSGIYTSVGFSSVPARLLPTGLIYVIGTWYLREEMGVRVALFNISGPLGVKVTLESKRKVFSVT